LEVFRRRIARVCLDAYLGIGVNIETGANRAKNAGQIVGRKQRRRAAAEEHGRHARLKSGPRLDLTAQRFDIARFCHILVAGIRVEIAIAALLGAKRYVDVNARRTAARRVTYGHGDVRSVWLSLEADVPLRTVGYAR
jgi:hypothetical protein